MVVDINNGREEILGSPMNEGNDDNAVHSHFDGGDEMDEIWSPVDVTGSPTESVSQKNPTVVTMPAAAYKAMEAHKLTQASKSTASTTSLPLPAFKLASVEPGFCN